MSGRAHSVLITVRFLHPNLFLVPMNFVFIFKSEFNNVS